MQSAHAAEYRSSMRIAIVGHVEHIRVGRLPRVPEAGEIAHLEQPRTMAGGGGGISFFQLSRSSAEIHLYTALGHDDAGAEVARRLHETGARIHAARRAMPHTRDLVMITPD